MYWLVILIGIIIIGLSLALQSTINDPIQIIRMRPSILYRFKLVVDLLLVIMIYGLLQLR